MFVSGRQVLLGAALAVLWPGAAAAEAGPAEDAEESARYQLVYEAPAECPKKQALLAQINHRIDKEWAAPPDQLAGTLTVAVSKVGDHYQSRMTLADRWGHVAFRILDAEGCDAALSDVAVAAVAAIESRLGPQPPYFELGVLGGPDWRTGLLAWGGGALVGLRWPTSRRSLHLAVGYWIVGAGHANRLADVELRFRLFSMRLEFCPFEPRLGPTISLPLCASAEGGLLQARHVDTIGRSPSFTGWTSLGLAPQVRWSGNSLFVQIGPRADFLLYPRRLTDTPTTDGQPSQRETIHRFPSVGFAAIATVGLKLP